MCQVPNVVGQIGDLMFVWLMWPNQLLSSKINYNMVNRAN